MTCYSDFQVRFSNPPDLANSLAEDPHFKVDWSACTGKPRRAELSYNASSAALGRPRSIEFSYNASSMLLGFPIY